MFVVSLLNIVTANEQSLCMNICIATTAKATTKINNKKGKTYERKSIK